MKLFKRIRDALDARRNSIDSTSVSDSRVTDNKRTTFLDKFRKQRQTMVKLRTKLASHRKWSFMSLAIIAVCVVILYFSGGLSSVGAAILKMLK